MADFDFMAFSPISFLLWCIGLKGRLHSQGNLLRATTGNDDLQRRRGGRRCARGNDSDSSDQGERKSGVRVATLGEGGRLSAFDKLRELQQKGACCDVTLMVGGKKFKAHKCILAAQSIPLRAMFEGAFKEGSEDVITLRGVEPSSFGLLLDFLYDRSIEINVENVEALLDLSARYCVSLLRRHCCVFVARSADSSNACLLLAVADRYDCHRLRKRLLVYTLEMFPLTCCDRGLDGFRHLSFALVAEVLKDDQLKAGKDGEVKVFLAAVSWLELEPCRERHADEVLSHVRFGLISAKLLAEVVETHPLVQTKAGKGFVHEAYRYQALPPESREDFASLMDARARPRSAEDDLSLSSDRVRRGGCSLGGLGGRLEATRVSSCEGYCSDESEGVGGEETGKAVELEGNVKSAANCESDQNRDGGLRAAPLSGSAKEMCEKGGDESEMRHSGETYSSMSHSVHASPSRKSWGSGLRMYV